MDHAHPARSGVMSYEQAVRVSRQAKQLKEQLDEIIVEAHSSGRRPVEIARDFLLTESYVYRILREATRYYWRLDALVDDAWHPQDEGGVALRDAGLDGFAQRVIDEHFKVQDQQGTPTRRMVRVVLWAGDAPAGDESDAVLIRERNPGFDPES